MIRRSDGIVSSLLLLPPPFPDPHPTDGAHARDSRSQRDARSFSHAAIVRPSTRGRKRDLRERAPPPPPFSIHDLFSTPRLKKPSPRISWARAAASLVYSLRAARAALRSFASPLMRTALFLDVPLSHNSQHHSITAHTLTHTHTLTQEKIREKPVAWTPRALLQK